MPTNPLSPTRADLLRELQQRVDDRVLEPTNAALLRKLIERADTDDEAIAVAALGTTYKRTGFHFDVRLERLTSDIRYLRRNPALSFITNPTALTHRLIIGDNYEALQNLLIQYRGLVDVIYIDPPYGKDSLGEFADTNYNNALTRDNLLSMLYPRLVLARQLLSDTGVIFCSIDDKNQAYVKCLFDEVFGERNFVANFIWKKKQGGGNDAKFVVAEHEYVIMYARNQDTFQIGKDLLYKTDDKLYPFHDAKGDYGLITLDKASIQFSQSLVYEIVDKKGNSYYPRVVNGKQSCWRWGKQKVKEQFEELVFKNGKVYTKYYRPIGITPRSLLVDAVYGRTESGKDDLASIFRRVSFDYPKPKALLSHLISLNPNKSSLILDFFAGSGTTGHAVLELNRKDGGQRKFILCQLNEKTDTTPNGIAYDVTTKRLKRIMTGMCYDGTADFPWIKTNEPYGDNLEVTEIDRVFNAEATTGKTPFDVIDETLYGQQPFTTMREKIEWVCQHFQHAQKAVENDSDWEKRKRDLDHATRS